MTRNSSNVALTAIQLLISLNILVYIFRNDLKYQLNLNKTYRISDGGIQSMILSMFYHIEPAHLALNVLALYRYGNELFVSSTSKRWRSFSIVIFSYLACGILSLKGLEILSKYHEHQWKRKLKNARTASKCTYWLCESINQGLGIDVTSYFTNVWSDITTAFPFTNTITSMYHFQLVRRIGASGVIYGWMGMRLFTSLFSRHHSKMSNVDYFFLIGTFAHDISKSPLTLDELSISTFLDGDNVDHAAHFFGAVGGIILALFILLWDQFLSVGWRSWRGEGIRLGERWEVEQTRVERDRERRERSRLLGQVGNNFGNVRSGTRG